MSDLNVRADAVDVDDIMRQIRARIREKRGTDYTEAEVAKLASVKLEKFIDPKGVRSDLVEQFRRRVTESPADEFTEAMLYETPRPWLRRVRRLLNPILKLFFNPAAVSGALRKQGDVLQFEVIHNLVVEVTRLGIDVHNMKMRIESLSSRVDFDERRARALEGAVQFRPPTPRPEPRREQPPRQQSRPDQRPAAPRPAPRPDSRVESRPQPSIETPPADRAVSPVPDGALAADSIAVATDGNGVAVAPATTVVAVPNGAAPNGAVAGPDGERRRRRRRRRRRPGQNMAGAQVNGAPGAADAGGSAGAADAGDDGPDDGPDE